MLMEIIRWVKRLVEDELERANEEFPLFHSKHEAYGVLLEEFREAEDEWGSLEELMEEIETATFTDDDIELTRLRAKARHRALLCIGELVQYTAMLEKWSKSENAWEEL